MCGFLFKYRTVEQTYGTQQRIIIPDMTNGWAVHNTGNTNLILNNTDVITAGSSKSEGGNAGELYDGRIDIRFVVPAGLVDPPVNTAVFTFKYYLSAIRIIDNKEFSFTK